MLLWRPIWPKRTQKCVNGNAMFLSTILLKHQSSINRVLHINFGTSDDPMQHLCITAPKYGGLYRTFYNIRNTHFLSVFLVIRVQKWKMTDRLWCKLSALSKHVKLYDKLWISLSKAPFSNEPTSQPLLDFELKKVLLPPLGNFADISYLKENFKPHLLSDVCTLCSGALVPDSLLHMLL